MKSLIVSIHTSKTKRHSSIVYLKRQFRFNPFVFLLNFVQQHNSSLISRIKEPCIENELDMLICANHSLKQLNILESNDACGDYSSVLTFLNRCKTKWENDI